MKVEFEGKTFFFGFQHERNNTAEIYYDGKTGEPKGLDSEGFPSNLPPSISHATTCYVKDNEIRAREAETKTTEDPLFSACSFCYYTDQFSKEVGRKLALTRVLEDNFSKAFRTLAWAEYARTTNKAWKQKKARPAAR